MPNSKDVPILIADDEPATRQLLASVLRSFGYSEVEYAQDGRQAMAVLSAPDCAIGLAFLDINMPAFTGLEVIGMARAQLPACFFVIISAHSVLDNVLAALKEGARGFIVKPYTAQKIHDILQKFETETAA